jgi:hypothetical protein
MRKEWTVQVGADGVLTLSLALGDTGANKPARVIVETLDETSESIPLTQEREAWLRFLEQTGGSITDPTFERQPQGDYEERDRFP